MKKKITRVKEREQYSAKYYISHKLDSRANVLSPLCDRYGIDQIAIFFIKLFIDRDYEIIDRVATSTLPARYRDADPASFVLLALLIPA